MSNAAAPPSVQMRSHALEENNASCPLSPCLQSWYHTVSTDYGIDLLIDISCYYGFKLNSWSMCDMCAPGFVKWW